MYSVVLMMALSGGVDSTAFCGGRCGGCSGRCSGCAGWSCGGRCSGCHDRGRCGGRCHARCSGRCGCSGYACGGWACSGWGCAGSGCGVVIVEPKKEEVKEPKPKEGNIPAPATILVNLPAEAKLFVDDTATKSTSTSRLFVSPNLEPGKEFVYTLKAEIVRDGKPVTATKEVTVRAGEETRVNIEFPETVAAK